MCKSISIIIASAVFLGCSTGRAEVDSHTFDVDGWWGGEVRLEIDLGFGLANVDSVCCEVSGTAHLGAALCGYDRLNNPIYRDCWTGVFINFLGEPSQGVCFESGQSVPCIGAFFIPYGDGEPFVEELCLVRGNRRGYMSPPEYFEIIELAPDLGDLFVDGVSMLSVKATDSGCEGWGCSRLPDINQITIRVFYNKVMNEECCSWSTLKATFR